MKGRLVLLVLLMVVLASLLATAVFADEEDPTTPACTTPGWWLEYVTTTYTGTHTVLELALKQKDAQHDFSNAGWEDLCFLCENFVSINYRTKQMVEQGLEPISLSGAEVECENDSSKIVINRTFELTEAPITLRFEINIESAILDQPYTFKWAQSECQGSVLWFDCEEPPTAVRLVDFNAKPLKLPWLARLRWLWPW